MSRIVQSLKRLCRIEPSSDELERRLVALSGLPVIRERDPCSDYMTLWRQMGLLVERRDLAALAAMCRREAAQRSRFANGRSRSELILNAMLAPIEDADGDPEQCEDELALYEAWWQQDRRNPAAAGLYAAALSATGFAYRGGDWADNVSESQWALLRDFSNRAEAVLASAGEAREGCWIWSRCRMRTTFIAYGIGEASQAAVRQAFEAARDLDPLEVSVYEQRVVQLLPRWGGSYAALEQLARQTYVATRPQLGAEMYARIYDTIVKWEERGRTLIDHHLMREGLEHWLARTPSQHLANRCAAHAHAEGDLATLTALFEHAIREIHPGVWFAPGQPLAAWQAASAFRTGRG